MSKPKIVLFRDIPLLCRQQYLEFFHLWVYYSPWTDPSFAPSMEQWVEISFLSVEILGTPRSKCKTAFKSKQTLPVRVLGILPLSLLELLGFSLLPTCSWTWRFYFPACNIEWSTQHSNVSGVANFQHATIDRDSTTQHATVCRDPPPAWNWTQSFHLAACSRVWNPTSQHAAVCGDLNS